MKKIMIILIPLLLLAGIFAYRRFSETPEQKCMRQVGITNIGPFHPDDPEFEKYTAYLRCINP